MSLDHSTAEIAEDRPLSDEERALVRWMLEHGEPDAAPFLSQLADARVISRCRCGCASIDFAIREQRAPTEGGMDILSDHFWGDADGHHFGAFVFARAGLLAGLDVYSLDGAVTPTWLPEPAQLRPLPHATQEV